MVSEQMGRNLFRSFENNCRTGYAKLTRYIFWKQYKIENQNVSRVH